MTGLKNICKDDEVIQKMWKIKIKHKKGYAKKTTFDYKRLKNF